MTVNAMYEDGVFRPKEPVDLPEKAVVELEYRVISSPGDTSTQSCIEPNNDALSELSLSENNKQIIDILSRRYDTGQTDLAARHNEHQP